MKKFIFIALIFTLFASSAMAFEVVEPGETQQFTEHDDCELTPFTDGNKATNALCTPPSRVEAAAALAISAFNSDVTAFARSDTNFLVTSGNEAVLDATVSAKVDWKGVLFGAGILDAGASVKIEMFLVDETTGSIKGRTLVMSEDQDSIGIKGIDVGGTRVSGSSEVTFNGSVVRGHNHSIQLKLTCAAESGLIGLDIGCIFFDDVFGLGLSGDFHAKWTELSITVDQDIFERLDQIDQKLDLMDGKLDAMDGKLDAMDGKLDAMDGKLDEVIRLLLTPQGRRESNLGSFPLKPDATATQDMGGTTPTVQQTTSSNDRSSRSIWRRFFSLN